MFGIPPTRPRNTALKLNFLKPAAGRARSSCKGLSAENNVSLSTRCDEGMLVTLLVDIVVSGLFRRVQLLIPNAQSPLGRRPSIPPLRPPGRGKRHRAVGRVVAQDTAHTIYQSAVELNRPRDM